MVYDESVIIVAIMEKFVIIDGNAIIHRVYHAIPRLTTKDGTVVNAVYGFANILLKILDDLKPKYMAVTFDRKEPTFRHEMYKEYKAKRQKAPDELYAQFPAIKEMLENFKIKTYEKAGFEADDIIATLARAKTKIPAQKIIITGDMDTLQLIDDSVEVYALRQGIKDITIFDTKKVKEKFNGLLPEQMVDYKALRGDPSDNIPGVRGIGEKTAMILIKDFGTLENLYKELVKETEKTKKVKEKTKKLLLKFKPDAFKGKELVKLIDSVPLDFSLKICEIKKFETEKIIAFFEKFGFKSLIKRLEAKENPASPKKETKKIQATLL